MKSPINTPLDKESTCSFLNSLLMAYEEPLLDMPNNDYVYGHRVEGFQAALNNPRQIGDELIDLRDDLANKEGEDFKKAITRLRAFRDVYFDLLEDSEEGGRYLAEQRELDEASVAAAPLNIGVDTGVYGMDSSDFYPHNHPVYPGAHRSEINEIRAGNGDSHVFKNNEDINKKPQ